MKPRTYSPGLQAMPRPAQTGARPEGQSARRKQLFLLIGFRAVGKTTLLTQGIKQGFCPFGDEYLRAFQSLALPDDLLTTKSYSETNRMGSWFDLCHVSDLARETTLPDATWIHIDLLSLLFSNGTVIDDPQVNVPMLPSTLETAYSEQQISHCLIRYFCHPFFKRFDELLVNILFAPWEVCKSQWQTRRVQTRQSTTAGHPDLFELYVFEEGVVGESVHKAAYDGLATAMTYLKPTRLLQSQMLNNTLAIKTLQEATQA